MRSIHRIARGRPLLVALAAITAVAACDSAALTEAAPRCRGELATATLAFEPLGRDEALVFPASDSDVVQLAESPPVHRVPHDKIWRDCSARPAVWQGGAIDGEAIHPRSRPSLTP